MLKVAYCQISAHPTFYGINGCYYREPFIDNDGALLTLINENKLIDNICTKIEEKYLKSFVIKLSGLLRVLSGNGIQLLVFPEYTIPATALILLHEFSQRENCICISGTHSVKAINMEIYNSINMKIDTTHLDMNCCPVILPNGTTKPVFKKNKSKWEANIDIGCEKSTSNDATYIEYNNIKFAVAICIDALKVNISTDNIQFFVVPAATPSLGPFKNKFESILFQDIPTKFCNFCKYGGSTIYSHCPIEYNIPFADSNRIIPMDKEEEAVIIANIEVDSHTLKSKSVNTHHLVQVDSILPIYYKDDSRDISLIENIIEAIEDNNENEVSSLSNLLDIRKNGIIAARNKIIRDIITNHSIKKDSIKKWLKQIYINDFSLHQYEINWIKKTLELIKENLLKGYIEFSDKISNIEKRLYTYNSVLTKKIPEIIDIPVFDDTNAEDFTFQNRGGEIGVFKKALKESEQTIFIINSFSGLGKSALISRLKYYFSFNTIEKDLPKSAGFESFLRIFNEVTKEKIIWDTLESAEIKRISIQVARDLCTLNKTILVIKSIGNIFDDYNKQKTILFLNSLADNLNRLKSHIKVIIESYRTLPDGLHNDNIGVLKLKPLKDIYIERLIEQTANSRTYALILPQVPFSIISACNGNPAIAKMVGVYLADKINSKDDSSLVLDEIESFTNKYMDGILEKLRIDEKEKLFLREMSIFRIPVKEYAISSLPHYTNDSFIKFQEKMLVERNDEFYNLNTIFRKGLKIKLYDVSNLHMIAKKYYEEEYKISNSYIERAEQLYHESFISTLTRKKEMIYYSDDILQAAIDLCSDGNNIDIALSHLQLIRPWKNRNWSYQFYLAYCYILMDQYDSFQEAFDLAVCLKQENKEAVYFQMINKLIYKRKLAVAETLLNIVEEKYGVDEQTSALRISFLYANKSTREKAIKMAVTQTRNQYYNFYATKILVPILVREGYVEEALKELDKVLSVFPANEWCKSTKYRILNNLFYNENYENDEDNEDNNEEE